MKLRRPLAVLPLAAALLAACSPLNHLAGDGTPAKRLDGRWAVRYVAGQEIPAPWGLGETLEPDLTEAEGVQYDQDSGVFTAGQYGLAAVEGQPQSSVGRRLPARRRDAAPLRPAPPRLAGRGARVALSPSSGLAAQRCAGGPGSDRGR